MKFKFFEQIKKELNSNKPKEESYIERKDLNPIRACILDIENIDPNTLKAINLIEANGVNIDYYGDEKIYYENNMKNAGKRTYVISESNNKDKYSHSYYNCTGIIVVGKNKEGEEISFMSHQDPYEFLFDKKANFINDLSERIEKILQKVEKNDIDAIIFGGNRGDLGYQKSIKLIGNILREKLNFEPTVMTGPNFTNSQTNVFFDTKNRRLYIARDKRGTRSGPNESYLASELKKRSKEWWDN